MAEDLLRTPLYEEHLALGARMVPFAGYEMPVQYSGIIEEHRAVRARAGIFDVCHMTEFRVFGFGAFDFLQTMLTNDLSRISEVGQAQYTLMLNDDGGVIDDLIVYHSGAAAQPASIAAKTYFGWKWMSAITGIYDCCAITANASASSAPGTATRTTSQPAAVSSAICCSVVLTSAVSVVVIDCTEIGAPPPTSTLPTLIWRVLRRGASTGGGAAGIPRSTGSSVFLLPALSPTRSVTRPSETGLTMSAQISTTVITRITPGHL